MTTTVLPQRRKNESCSVQVEEPTLTPGQRTAITDRLKTIADPTRLGILDLLAQQTEPLCVCDILPRFAQNQPTISHHLKVLREDGLIDSEKRGLWSHCWATKRGRAALAAATELLKP
jgi:ArsR family transcriptional regulator, arsenate/arsenite/antimonite-responsive transcriptional repressor